MSPYLAQRALCLRRGTPSSFDMWGLSLVLSMCGKMCVLFTASLELWERAKRLLFNIFPSYACGASGEFFAYQVHRDLRLFPNCQRLYQLVPIGLLSSNSELRVFSHFPPIRSHPLFDQLSPSLPTVDRHDNPTLLTWSIHNSEGLSLVTICSKNHLQELEIWNLAQGGHGGSGRSGTGRCSPAWATVWTLVSNTQTHTKDNWSVGEMTYMPRVQMLEAWSLCGVNDKKDILCMFSADVTSF